MKKIFFSFSMFLLSILLFTNNIKAQTNNSSSSLLRHIVIITFKPGASADSIKELDNVFTELSKSPLVKSFEMGVDVSTRDTTKLKHVYVTTYASKEDMAAYGKIPLHARLFKIAGPISEDVTAADYWINK